MKLKQYFEKAELLKKELDSFRPLDKETEQRIFQKFRLDWNYHSNNIEGNSLSYGETKALILFGLTANGKPLKDHFEITGHDEAVKWILDIVKEERTITESFIRELHTLILKEPYEVDASTPDGKPTKKRVQIGEYKKTPNHVKTQTGEMFYFALPEETPAKMNDLINWYREKKEDSQTNPITLATEFHYKFILIHPFDDGNGRTARLLMNFTLMQAKFPPVIIKTQDKENYYRALRQADSGNLEVFFEYIAKNLIDSLELMLRGAKGEKIDEIGDLDKKLALLEKELNQSGSKIETYKSKETVENFIYKQLPKILSAFIETSEKFKPFYFDHNYEIIFHCTGATSSTVLANLSENYFQAVLDLYNNRISHSNSNRKYLKSILLKCAHLTFNRNTKKTEARFSYYDNTRISFKPTQIKIYFPKSKQEIILLYDEEINEEELKLYLEREAQHHFDYIQQMIDKNK